MSKKDRKRINNFNRCLIVFLSMSGLFSDGMQTNDMVFLIATICWVWLPELNRLDERIIQHFKG